MLLAWRVSTSSRVIERDAREGGAVRMGGRGRLASSLSHEALARRSPVHLLQMI